MADQTKIEERNGSPAGLARDVGEFAYDVLTLAELQGQLFVADARECSQTVLAPGLALLGGAALGLAALPIALVAVALWLQETLAISSAAGFLLAAGVALLGSAPVCVIGWFQIRKRLAVMQRSQQELVRNLSWIKKVLERSRITRNGSVDNSWRTVR